MIALDELKESMNDNGIKGEIATQLHDMTVMFTNGYINEQEYKDLISEIADINNQDDLADDKATSEWVINITQALLAAI